MQNKLLGKQTNKQTNLVHTYKRVWENNEQMNTGTGKYLFILIFFWLKKKSLYLVCRRTADSETHSIFAVRSVLSLHKEDDIFYSPVSF